MGELFCSAYPDLKAGVPSRFRPKLLGVATAENGGRVYRWTTVCELGSTAAERRLVSKYEMKAAVEAGHPHTDHLTEAQIDQMATRDQRRIRAARERRQRYRVRQKR